MLLQYANDGDVYWTAAKLPLGNVHPSTDIGFLFLRIHSLSQCIDLVPCAMFSVRLNRGQGFIR